MSKKLITEVVHKSTSREVKNTNNIDNLGEQDGFEQTGDDNEQGIRKGKN